MADNVSLKDGSGSAFTLSTTESGGVHTTEHIIVGPTGVALKVYAEDAAHTTADTGILVFAVRSDTAAATGTTDGDYCGLIVDSAGKLHTNVGAVTPGTAAGNLGKVEDAAHTTGDTGVFVLAVRADTAAATGTTDGDYCGLIVDSAGKLHTNVGAVTPGTAAANLGKAEDAAHSSGDTGVATWGVRADADATFGADGDYTPMATDAYGRQKTSVIEQRTVVTITPTMDTSAYGAGDLYFDTITCGNVARINGGVVTLESVTILDEDDNTAAALTLFFLDTNTSMGTINGAPNISDANAAKILGHLAIASGDWVDVGGAKIACVRNLGLVLKADAAAQAIYIAATCAGTPTNIATGLKVKLGFKQS